MNLTSKKSLLAGALALAMLASAAPANADEYQSKAEIVDANTGFGTPQKLREAAQVWDLGAPMGAVKRVTRGVYSQQFAQGYAVYSQGVEHAQAMSADVYDYWAHNPHISVEERIAMDGYPRETKRPEGASLTTGKGLITGFAQDAHDAPLYLQDVPAHGRVMDVTRVVSSHLALGWNESVLIAERQTVTTSSRHLAGALNLAGYAPYAVMGADSHRIHTLIGQGAYALPAGTPWVIYLASGEQDAMKADQTIDDLHFAAQELKKVYPHARIVIGDVLNPGTNPQLDKFSRLAESFAKAYGYGFTSTRGWADRYSITFEKDPHTQALSPVLDKHLGFYMKWNIRRAIGE